jgi:Methyltransferase domain
VSLLQPSWKKLRQLSPQPLDLARVELLRRSRLAELADPAELERLLCALGLNDEGIEEFPAELHPCCGQGLRIWQYPRQFSRYLCDLAGLAVRSYMEVGVRHGGTFVATVEYLERFSPLAQAIAVDIIPCPAVAEYARRFNPRAEFLRVNTQSEDFARALARHGEIDLVLIDACHEEAQCRRDFETVRDKANLIALHDVVNPSYPGVGRVWREIQTLPEFACREYTEQYAGAGAPSMGIGLAVRRDRLTHGG